MVTPLEAFNHAMFFVSGLCSTRTLNQPGVVIQRLSDKEREALKQLKSDDIAPNSKTLPRDIKYYVGADSYYQELEFAKDRLAFDKKIAKAIPQQTKYEE